MHCSVAHRRRIAPRVAGLPSARFATIWICHPSDAHSSE